MTIARDIRDSARRQLRDALLDAALVLAGEHGWHRVRMGQVAAAVGVSRQTAHAEFGTKEALGSALVLRETERFLAGVSGELERHRGDAWAAVTAAVRFTLQQGAENRLVRTILTSARGGDDSLLPLLTTRSEPVLHAASDVVAAYILEGYPQFDQTDVADVVDSLVRLTVSHLVLPVDPPDRVAQRLARLTLRTLGLDAGAQRA